MDRFTADDCHCVRTAITTSPKTKKEKGNPLKNGLPFFFLLQINAKFLHELLHDIFLEKGMKKT